MVKQQKKKNIKSKWFLKPWFLVMIVVLVGVFGFFGVRQYQIRQEKNDLLTKHQKLEEIADKIAAVNKPDKRESIQKCRYSSQKFQKGDLFCGFDIVMTYSNLENSISNNIMLAASAEIGSRPIINQLNSGVTTFPPVWDPKVSSLIQDFEAEEYADCGVSYTRSSPSELSNNFVVILSCNKKSLSEHFLVKK